MKYDLSRGVDAGDGETLKDEAGREVAMVTILRKVLASAPPASPMSWTRTQQVHALSKKLRDGGDGADVDLDADELKLIQDHLPLLGMPWVAGEIGAYLNSAKAG